MSHILITVRETAINLKAANPRIPELQAGLETDTGKIKVGDGLRAWNNLPYAEPEIASRPATVENKITDGDLDAPSQNAVFDALALINGGSGDVVGPNSSTDSHLAVFDGASGKLLKSGGTKVYANGSNLGLGSNAANSITSGIRNTAMGTEALYANTSGEENTALGDRALVQNTTGNANVAVGELALYTNNGDWNTAVGLQSMYSNTNGTENAAHGFQSLRGNTTGSSNTAVGSSALAVSTTADGNTAVGQGAGLVISTGAENTLVGVHAGVTLTTGSNNTVIGDYAVTSTASAANEIVIGSGAVGMGNNTTQIGNASVTDVHFGAGTAMLHTTKIGGYILPAVDGTAGQVLSTDGAGNLSWVTV